MTTYPVVRQDFQRWRLVLPTQRYGELTARMKTASLGWIDELWYDARNTPNVALLALREALQELPGIGATDG